MVGIVTPAMYEIAMGHGKLLPIEAYEYADRTMLDSGINPLRAFIDVEIQRQHFVMARNYFVKKMHGEWPALPDSPVRINLPPVILDMASLLVNNETLETKE